MLYSVKLPETFNQKPIERLEDLTKNGKNNEHQLEKMALLLNSDDEDNFDLATCSDEDGRNEDNENDVYDRTALTSQVDAEESNIDRTPMKLHSWI